MTNDWTLHFLTTMSSSKKKTLHPPQQHTTWVWTIPLSLVFLSLSCFCAFAITNNWLGKFSGAADIFCEANRQQRSVKQPVNTISSLMFVLAGLGTARYSNYRYVHKDWRVPNLLTRSAPLQTLYASTLIAIGVGSMFYHASGTTWSGTWDVVAQIPYASFLCVYSLIRLLQSLGNLQPGQESKQFWCMYLIVTSTFSMPRLLVDMEYAGPIAGLVLVFLFFEAFLYHRSRKTTETQQQSRRYLRYALICIVLGYIVLLFSTTDAIWCKPHSVIQGHALWHLLSAASMVLVFSFFVTQGETFDLVSFNEKDACADSLVVE